MRLQSLSRILLGLSTAALVLPFGAAHAQRAQDTGTTITMWAGPAFTPTTNTHIDAQHPTVVTALRILAANFKNQTGITVNFVNPAYGANITFDQYTSYMQTNIAAGTAPDVSWVPQGPDQSSHGWFMNLDSLLTKPNPFVQGNTGWRSEYYPALYNAPNGSVGVGGHHFAVPIVGNYPYIIIGVAYNKSAWAKAGITTAPKTWEEWMAQLAKLKAGGGNVLSQFDGAGKTTDMWPMWSMLYPSFMAYLAPKIDIDHNGAITNVENAKAWAAGVLKMSDPHMQATFQQYKRLVGYYLPGWNVANIVPVWNSGKLAERLFGFWELATERSNTQRKFDFGFFPPVTLTKATSPLVTWTPKYAPTGLKRLEASSFNNGLAIIAKSVAAHKNQDAVVKWVQFLSTPAANDFMVNENAVGVPAIRGVAPAPVYNQLNNLPVPDFGSSQASDPDVSSYNVFALFPDEYTKVSNETLLWLLGNENDTDFFAHMQAIVTPYVTKYLAQSK
jgi:raffinose/stachyose/melibiose transport system substrate-binding protein